MSTKKTIQNQISWFKLKLDEKYRAALVFKPTCSELRESLMEIFNREFKSLPLYAKERIKEYKKTILDRILRENVIELYSTKNGYIHGYENVPEDEKKSFSMISKFYWLEVIKTVDENGVITITKIPTDKIYIG
jgi:hypothetical protein